VYELAFSHPSAALANPWAQVTVSVTFTSPSRTFTVGGFYYDTNTWKARVAPDQLGIWSWQATLQDSQQGNATFSGSFEVIDTGEPGFLRVNPSNPRRLVMSNGRPYTPVGFNDCMPDRLTPSCCEPRTRHGVPWPFSAMGFDGDFRWPTGCTTPIAACWGGTFACPRADCPVGDTGCCSPTDACCQANGWSTDIETYLTAYGAAGFNLFRWGSDNCSFGLFQTIDPAGNVYKLTEGQWADELFRRLRAHGFRVFMTMWLSPPFSFPTPAQQAAEIAYANYVVDRYGAYIDLFEIFNEGSPDPTFENWMSAAIKARDPYGHFVTMSYPDPANPSYIDVTSPHWYSDDPLLSADQATVSEISNWPTNKPLIFGEAGGANENWSPQTRERMRKKMWTALFNEATLVFWNSTYAKDNASNPANQYIGPQERADARVWSTFASALDVDTVMASTSTSANLRSYGLKSASHAWAYVVNATDNANPTTGGTLTLTSPIAGTATFVSPSDGGVLGTTAVTTGSNTLPLPPFVADLAVRIGP